MAEKQADHRMELEKTVIKTNLMQSGRGQHYGLIIAILLVAAVVYLGYIGQPVVAGFLGSGTIIGLVTIFVLGKKSQRRSLKEKST